MSNQLITQFFKQRKTDTDKVIPKETNKTISEIFYEKCIQSENSKCCKQECINAKAEFQAKVNELREKCATIEKAISTCSLVVEEKNLEIENLRKKIEKSTIKEVNNDSESDRPTTIIFNQFTKDFKSEQLAHLRSIGNSIREDSSFVLYSVNSLYEENLSHLKLKSVTGRSNNGEKKEPLTPKKLTTLQNIFRERLDKMNIDDQERGQRKKKSNRYISLAIISINKAMDTKNMEQNICNQLRGISIGGN